MCCTKLADAPKPLEGRAVDDRLLEEGRMDIAVDCASRDVGGRAGRSRACFLWEVARSASRAGPVLLLVPRFWCCCRRAGHDWRESWRGRAEDLDRYAGADSGRSQARASLHTR